MSLSQVPSEYWSDDVIFHYTKTETAIEKILPTKELKFGNRLESFDPLENEVFNGQSIVVDPSNLNQISSKLAGELFTEKKRIRDTTLQLCFCSNNPPLKDSNSTTEMKWENYGFAKPRMWDQYADHYKGVCLAFSKEKILSALSNHGEIIAQKVEYEYYGGLYSSRLPINFFNRQTKEAQDRHWNWHLNALKADLFRKHVDYKDEREFRICYLPDQQYQTVRIEDALLGVIIPLIGVNQHLIRAIRAMLPERVLVHVMKFNNGLIRLNPADQDISGIESHYDLLREYRNQKTES